MHPNVVAQYVAQYVQCLVSLCLVLALDLSQRTSLVAFDILVKIEMHWGHLREAMELVKEWRMIDPEVQEI